MERDVGFQRLTSLDKTLVGKTQTPEKCPIQKSKLTLSSILRSLKLLVKRLPSFVLLLLYLDLIFVTTAMHALPIASHIELYVKSLAEEVKVLRGGNK